MRASLALLLLCACLTGTAGRVCAQPIDVETRGDCSPAVIATQTDVDVDVVVNCYQMSRQAQAQLERQLAALRVDARAARVQQARLIAQVEALQGDLQQLLDASTAQPADADSDQAIADKREAIATLERKLADTTAQREGIDAKLEALQAQLATEHARNARYQRILEEIDDDRRTPDAIHVVGFGLAGAGLLTAVIAGAVALDKNQQLEPVRSGAEAPDLTEERAYALREDARTYNTVADIGLIVMAVGLVAGGFYLYDLIQDTPGLEGASLGVAADRVQLSARVRFGGGP